MNDLVFTIDNVSPIDFLGANDEFLKMIVEEFPKSRIIPRGNELIIKSTTEDLIMIQDILNGMLDYIQKFGNLTRESVEALMLQSTHNSNGAENDVIVFGHKGNVIKARTSNQRKLVKASYEQDIVFALGPAGTGKTYISVALAVRALKNKLVKKIIFTRPAVEAGENLGFLPGDLKEKIDPFLRPIYDALEDMLPPEKVKLYMEANVIEIAPLAYMRGRTLNNAFVILDEAQNTTPMQLKMFLTRLGPSSKMIINGDKSQIDLGPKQPSGLVESLKILNNIKGIGIVTLDGMDVVRHRLVREIIQAYDKHNA